MEADATSEEVSMLNQLDRECALLREEKALLAEVLQRAERKLSAYVGVCSGDKELTDAVLPMCRAALAKVGGADHD